MWLLALWELITIGFDIPRVLLPAPSLVGQAIGESLSVLAADFQQTVIRAVIPGFLLGNLAGFGAALAADRWQFLGRGLLPVGNLVSAIPIIGIAPIMVMWFGFDWQSKAAVVVIMTFFPMLVNTISGLKSSTAIELDLMRAVGGKPLAVVYSSPVAERAPFYFQCIEDQFGVGIDWRHRGGVLRHAYRWDGVSYLDGSGPYEYGDGLGIDRCCGGVWICFLWITGNSGAARDLLARVVPPIAVRTPLAGHD